ncbi:hypothetical protein ACFWF3_32990, partial [Nocardia sp. NPDC060220]|uniref:hypothetical protein n=1 Tax=Nocardia sp. NPDC060220 TaxID=3347076 RepID=UPI0036606F4D
LQIGDDWPCRHPNPVVLLPGEQRHHHPADHVAGPRAIAPEIRVAAMVTRSDRIAIDAYSRW